MILIINKNMLSAIAIKIASSREVQLKNIDTQEGDTI